MSGSPTSAASPPPPAKPATPAAVPASSTVSSRPAFTSAPVTTPEPGYRAQPSRGALPILGALGFLLLLVGLAYLWQRQETFMSQRPAIDPVTFAGVEGQVRTLGPRISQLEQRPAPDLKPLEARIAALEAKPAATAPAAPAAPAVDVSGAVAAAVGPLTQRLDAMAKEGAAAQSALAAKVEAATTQAATQAQGEAARIDALEKKLAAAEQHATDLVAQNVRATRAQQAMAALESGKPLGDIPGAPPAAAKFAAAKPPTEPELRLAFPTAASSAINASAPSGEGLSLGERMLRHAETLVTVRKGDAVVVGTSAAQTLGLAKEKLDAGDLAGAVAALDGLDAGAAKAMAAWRAQAQSLIDARAALASMTVAASH